MKYFHHVSAGELFELLRPAVFFLSVLLSAIVLSSTLKREKSLLVASLWTAGTFFAPPVIFPAYWIYRLFKFARPQAQIQSGDSETNDRRNELIFRGRMQRLLVTILFVLLLSGFGVVWYRYQRESADAHFAGANNAKLMGEPERTIAEYRAALAVEDSPHTHNLLAQQLAAQKDWQAASDEFAKASAGGEPDPRLSYNLAVVLSELGKSVEAAKKYEEFLSGRACTDPLPDASCADARKRISAKAMAGH